MRSGGGVRKPIHQSWLAKGLGLGLLCWRFKGVHEEIPCDNASTLQIETMAFPAGQCTSPQLHPCRRLFDQDNSSASIDLASCDFCLFPKLRGCVYETIEDMKAAVTKVIDTVKQEDFHVAFKKLLERYNKCIAVGYNFEGDLNFMRVLSIKVPLQKSLETYLMIRVYIYIYIYIYMCVCVCVLFIKNISVFYSVHIIYLSLFISLSLHFSLSLSPNIYLSIYLSVSLITFFQVDVKTLFYNFCIHCFRKNIEFIQPIIWLQNWYQENTT